MEDGIKKVGDQTSVMSDETIARFETRQDAWSIARHVGHDVAGGIIANTIEHIQSMTKSWTNFASFIANATVLGKGVGGAVKIAQQEAREIAFWENAHARAEARTGVTTVRLGETKTATEAALKLPKNSSKNGMPTSPPR